MTKKESNCTTVWLRKETVTAIRKAMPMRVRKQSLEIMIQSMLHVWRASPEAVQEYTLGMVAVGLDPVDPRDDK